MARQRQGFKQGFVRRSQQESAEIAALEAAIAAGAPAPGTNVVGTSAAHPSDDQPEGGARTNGKATSGRQAAAPGPAAARQKFAKSGPGSSGRGGTEPESDAAQSGYAHAKLFTELPLSSATQVRAMSMHLMPTSQGSASGFMSQAPSHHSQHCSRRLHNHSHFASAACLETVVTEFLVM